MTALPSGMGAVIETVQLAVPAEGIVVGAQTIADTVTCGAIVTIVEAVTPFQTAEIETFVVPDTVSAVAVTLAEVLPAGIVTDAGKLNPVGFCERATAADVARAVVSRTVQVVEPPGAIDEAEQDIPESAPGGTRLTFAVFVRLPADAEIVAVAADATAPDDAVNVAVDEPDGTVTDAGTVKSALFELKPTAVTDETAAV